MKSNKIKSSLLFTALTLSIYSFGQSEVKNEAPLSEKAPADKPVDIYEGQLRKFDSLIAPYILQARKSLPPAKERFLKGLPEGEAFFLTIRIFDKDKKMEQVFIRVKDWNEDKISGTIASQLNLVKEYKMGQLIYFTENEIMDWLISKPDGSEEGNFIGKFLDTQ